MKLINRKTGQVVVFGEGMVNLQEIGCKNVAEMLEAGWEDYKEAEDFWYISPTGTPIKSTTSIYDPLEIYLMKRIGNYFETKEEAEKAVEKLKAITRLKDKRFRFNGYIREHKKGSADITIASHIDDDCGTTEDLVLLFGGEE